jgi:hypothetical protein
MASPRGAFSPIARVDGDASVFFASTMRSASPGGPRSLVDSMGSQVLSHRPSSPQTSFGKGPARVPTAKEARDAEIAYVVVLCVAPSSRCRRGVAVVVALSSVSRVRCDS